MQKQEQLHAAGRTAYLSLANAIATVAVIYLHANGVFWSFSRSSQWLSANAIESICYFAVPVFFMITGANLMDYQDRYDLRTFFRKRIRKTLIPFVIWTAIAVPYHVYFLKDVPASKMNLLFLAHGMMTSSIVPPFWFFPAVFEVYLCLPLFASVPRGKRPRLFRYLLAAGFLINSLLPLLCQMIRSDLQMPLAVQAVSGAMFYAVAGYEISTEEISPRCRRAIYALGILGLALHMAGTQVLSLRDGSINQLFKGYYNVPCVLYSIAVFTLLRQHGDRLMKGAAGRAVELFSRSSFAVYLLHWFVLNGIIQLAHPDIYSLKFRLLVPIPVILISLGLAFLIRRIPRIGRVLLP